MQLAVSLRDVSFAYPGGPAVLSDVDLDVRSGEFVGIAGPNGGGKTTLVRIALGLERPQTGEALLYGQPAHRFTERVRLGYLAQRTMLGIDAPVSVGELVAAGRVPRRGLARPFGSADRSAVAQESFAALLEQLHAELGATILYISHEFGAVERYVERLILVRGGITFDGPPSALPSPWHDPSHVHP
jgi:ABC-type Mn2+/Zn2+ transport system ATPase subunit